MTAQKRRTTVRLKSETYLRIKAAAIRKGVSVDQYLSGAAHKKPNRKARTMRGIHVTAGISMRGKANLTPVSLEKLFAACDEITQGRVSSTDSADLIREAREERHRDMEGHGSA